MQLTPQNMILGKTDFKSFRIHYKMHTYGHQPSQAGYVCDLQNLGVNLLRISYSYNFSMLILILSPFLLINIS